MERKGWGGRPNDFRLVPIDGETTVASFPFEREEKKVSSPKPPKAISTSRWQL
jgi:hypothetical protein